MSTELYMQKINVQNESVCFPEKLFYIGEIIM